MATRPQVIALEEHYLDPEVKPHITGRDETRQPQVALYYGNAAPGAEPAKAGATGAGAADAVSLKTDSLSANEGTSARADAGDGRLRATLSTLVHGAPVASNP